MFALQTSCFIFRSFPSFQNTLKKTVSPAAIFASSRSIWMLPRSGPKIDMYASSLYKFYWLAYELIQFIVRYIHIHTQTSSLHTCLPDHVFPCVFADLCGQVRFVRPICCICEWIIKLQMANDGTLTTGSWFTFGTHTQPQNVTVFVLMWWYPNLLRLDFCLLRG